MDTFLTVTGNLTSDPVQRVTASGAIVVGLRVASSARRFDRDTQQWRDGEPMFISASCWRQLAGNVMATLRKGDSVVIHGRLSMRTFDDRQGARRSVHEIDAIAIGPDLTRYPAEVRRPQRPPEAVPAGSSSPTVSTDAGDPAAVQPAAVQPVGDSGTVSTAVADEGRDGASERGKEVAA